MLLAIGMFVVKFIASLFICILSIFWGMLINFKLLLSMWKIGPKKLFYYKKRNAPPKNYYQWSYKGSSKKWKHANLTIPESQMKFHFVHSGKFPEHLEMTNDEVVKRREANSHSRLVVCVHGFPETWYSWRYLLRHMENSNDFVVAIDARGYGGSDKPKSIADYHLNHLTADVKGITHALGYKHCHVISHDWGGIIAWQTLINYHELLKCLIVLNCPHPDAMAKVQMSSPKQMFIKSWYIFFFQLPFLPELLVRLMDYNFVEESMNDDVRGIINKTAKLDEDDLDVFKHGTSQSLTYPINYYRALIRPFQQPGPEPMYPKSPPTDSLPHVPILLMWGDQDAFMDIEMASETEKMFEKQPDAASCKRELKIIPNASHWLQQDQPEIINNEITSFLKDI